MKKNELKLLAVIGGSVVVMLGVLGVALGQEQASPSSVASSGMSTGGTVTATHPPTAPKTAMATPRIKGGLRPSLPRSRDCLDKGNHRWVNAGFAAAAHSQFRGVQSPWLD